MRWVPVMTVVVAACVVSAPVVAPIAFEDIAHSGGVRFSINNSVTPERRQPEAMVAGVAIFDYDGDGFPDVFFVNGADMPSLEKKGPQYSNRLFHNNRNLTFTDVTEKAGLAGAGYGMGVAVGDYDNDGRPDIFIANVNANQLFHNNGDGTFTDVTAKAGVAGANYGEKKMWSVAAAWVDYNRDGLLDLFVSNYCRWDANDSASCVVNGHRSYCSPRYYKPLPNTLYRNNGDGTFTDVSEATGIAKHLGRGMGVGIGDYDNDGWPDIFVANDNSPGQLFHNMEGKRFDEVGQEAMVAYSADGNILAGMGVGFADVLNNGLRSLWVSSVENQTFPLYVNLGRGEFEDQSSARGLAAPTSKMSGWSNALLDLDNDGWKDAMVARSNVMDNIALFAPRTYEEPNAIFRNVQGRFVDVSATAGASFQRAAAHRGLAYGDLDNDGRMDVVVSVLNGEAEVFHNTTGNRNHWLTFQLTGTVSNRMGLGAKIKLTASDGRVQYNDAQTSTGFACSSDPRVHFGLGAAQLAKDVEITWPSGRVQKLTNIAADRIVKITEP